MSPPLPLPRLPGRPAIVSHVLPPSPSGQAIVLERLLSGFAPDSFCLMSREDYSRPPAWHPREGDLLARLPATYHHLAEPVRLGASLRPLPPWLRHRAGLTIRLLHRAWRIRQLVDREGCGAVLAASGDLLDLPAGYIASRLCGVPFFAYLFDDYACQWTVPGHRAFARQAERALIRGAAAVVVPNPALAEVYRRRHACDPVVLPNPAHELACQGAAPPAPPAPPEPGAQASRGNGRRIVYTGSIYGAHFDAFANLGEALARLGRAEVSVHVYTWQDPAELRRELPGIDITYHPHLIGGDLATVQREADLLFLALAFTSEIPEAVRTASPAKLGDYLASGRPILVHAPAPSFVADYFRRHECGWLVDSFDAGALAEGIARLLDDSAAAADAIRRAGERHAEDFSLVAARCRLVSILASAGCADPKG
jgi:glycosyltransferase involved in cell wall biosynthesis